VYDINSPTSMRVRTVCPHSYIRLFCSHRVNMISDARPNGIWESFSVSKRSRVRRSIHSGRTIMTGVGIYEENQPVFRVPRLSRAKTSQLHVSSLGCSLGFSSTAKAATISVSHFEDTIFLRMRMAFPVSRSTRVLRRHWR